MGALAVDASAVIALLHDGDAHHQQAVVEFDGAAQREDTLSISASAYSEILVHALRSGRAELIERFVDRLQIEVVPVDRALARRAAELCAERRSLRLPDALVLATAQARGARLLSFDDRLAQV